MLVNLEHDKDFMKCLNVANSGSSYVCVHCPNKHCADEEFVGLVVILWCFSSAWYMSDLLSSEEELCMALSALPLDYG